MTADAGERPAPVLFNRVVGQEAAVSTLRAAARRTVHAYLFVGPPGTGKRAAAVAFAAALLCPTGGDGTCDTCRRVLAGVHPDVVPIERVGPFITMETAITVGVASVRSPVESNRKVLLLVDFHLVREAGPALLKTIEEPPASTVFVILAEFLPPELVTIASRCVVVEFRSLPLSAVAAALVADGVEEARAEALAALSGGRLDRARLLVADPEVAVRRQAWQAAPSRLDGTGSAAVAVAKELEGLLERSVAPLRQRQAAEVADLDERLARAAEVGGRGASKRSPKAAARELEERHTRELRRQRTDELRAGLAALAGVYRDRLVAAGAHGAGGSIEAVRLIQDLNANLAFNPNVGLQLQALFVRLGRLPATAG